MQTNGRSKPMWNDPATSRLMFRLNAVAACVYGGASVFLSSTYRLYGGDGSGHPVGHLIGAGTAVGTALWSLLCVLLYLTDRGLRRRWEAWLLALPFALACVSGWICNHRYWQQI